MIAVDVPFVLSGSDARPPLRAYNQDAGADLPTLEEMVISPGKTINLPTGISVEIPPGYWAMIVGRSSASSLLNLVVITGIIDQGYRGELFVRVLNPNNRPVTILKHQRIAQIIFMPLVIPKFHQVRDLSPGERGMKGFGSSGT